jgi:hypothetical protein
MKKQRNFLKRRYYYNKLHDITLHFNLNKKYKYYFHHFRFSTKIEIDAQFKLASLIFKVNLIFDINNLKIYNVHIKNIYFITSLYESNLKLIYKQDI